MANAYYHLFTFNKFLSSINRVGDLLSHCRVLMSVSLCVLLITQEGFYVGSLNLNMVQYARHWARAYQVPGQHDSEKFLRHNKYF